MPCIRVARPRPVTGGSRTYLVIGAYPRCGAIIYGQAPNDNLTLNPHQRANGFYPPIDRAVFSDGQNITQIQACLCKAWAGFCLGNCPFLIRQAGRWAKKQNIIKSNRTLTAGLSFPPAVQTERTQRRRCGLSLPYTLGHRSFVLAGALTHE